PVEKTAAAFAEPEVADVEEETPVVAPIARATSGYVAPRGSVNSPLRQSSASAAPARTGIHTVPPAASRHESTKAEKDLRVTQLTTATPAQATVHVNPRSQSLFARITGIGMVRPSAREEEDDLDTDDRATAQQRLSIDPSDRPAISGSESDVLEIPTFLRRQSNH
ncbi:MAG: hypothetical protein HGA90_01640, partial [Alphaproteobacteria bacterium]|nr:hypothetical protein [Alphaproteobacteria bacterium]